MVIGTIDPNIKVAGSGIKRLIEAGINVTVGVLESDCKELNKRFFTFHEKKRPYVILKWAESQDGFIAPIPRQTQDEIKNRNPVWITNEFSRQLVHKWRSEEQAILVGTNTVVNDNPKLDGRDWFGSNPIRIVLDQNNRIPKDSHIYNNAAKTIIFSQIANDAIGENTTFEVIDYKQNLAKQILKALHKHNIQSIIIEGGRQTLQTFIDEDLCDEARIFIGNKNIKNGIKAPNIALERCEKHMIADDVLLISRNYD